MTHLPSDQRLPLLLSVPHAGKAVPLPAQPYCILTEAQIIADGDEGAAEIYDLSPHVEALISTEVARAIVDLNRAEDDRRKDGAIKTHTSWDEPVYRSPLPPDLEEMLIRSHHRSYHARLSEMATEVVVLAIDCHTMAAVGPPVGPDPGRKRPRACLSNADGTCPNEWLEGLAQCLRDRIGGPVTLNEPFAGGYIIRKHSAEMPWLQLELSRAPFLSLQEKRLAVLGALRSWCAEWT